MNDYNGIKTKLLHANYLKDYLKNKNLLNLKYLSEKENNSIIFPIIKNFNLNNLDFDCSFVKCNFKAKIMKKTYKDLVLQIIPSELSFKFNKAYDIFGNIAIVEIESELIPYETEIAKILIESNDKIKSVYKKSGAFEGEFRIQNYIYLAGIENELAEHCENNVKLNFNIGDLYFSSRLSNERKRIANLVKLNESVLIMFSGCGPYTYTIAKNSFANKIISIEKNPKACYWANINLDKNKLSSDFIKEKYLKKKEHFDKIKFKGPLHVENHCGDVREIIPLLKKEHDYFDRIIMPLPHIANNFLDIALLVAKKGTMFHLYDFMDLSELENIKLKIKKECKIHGFDIEIKNIEICGEFSPNIKRICIDFLII